MTELPENWGTAPLSAISSDVPQRVPDPAEKFTYIDIGSIDRKTKTIAAPQELLGKDAPSRARKQVATGDTLVSMTRPNLNAVALVPPSLDGQIASTGFDVLRPLEGIDPRWLAYLVRTEQFVSTMSELVQGALYPAVRTKDVRAYEAPVAPAEEQTRIADQLDTLLARINACQRRLDNIPALLKRFRQAVLDAATTGALIEDWPTCDVTQWPTVSLGAHASDFSYGTAAKSEKSGRVPVLRMGNIQGGRLDWTDLVYTSNEAEIKKYELKKGDVLFNRTNSPELVGKTAVYQGEQPAIYAGYLIRVRCNDDLLPEYLNYCLGSTAGRDFCWAVKSDGVSQSNINAKKLRSFSFLLPTRVEQHEIVRRAESHLRLVDRFEARYIAMHSHTQRLAPQVLAKAFRGELAPQDPKEEPAITLLVRIAGASAEQAAISKPKKHTRRLELKSMTDEPLLNIIDHFDQADFTFDELRQATSLGYEALKNELFALLADPESGVAQHFDAEEKTMKLRRVRK
jgi:type I restriction enzyme S subunit